MKFNHILSGLALTAAVLAAGCQKSLEYSDVVYFTGTENSNITNMYVDGPSSMGVTVTSSCKMAADVQVALAVDAAAVDAYNALHGTDYRMLPAGSYRLSDDAVTIAEGTNVSTPSSFEIVSMDDFDRRRTLLRTAEDHGHLERHGRSGSVENAVYLHQPDHHHARHQPEEQLVYNHGRHGGRSRAERSAGLHDGNPHVCQRLENFGTYGPRR